MGLTSASERLWKLSNCTALPSKDYHVAAGPPTAKTQRQRQALGWQPQADASHGQQLSSLPLPMQDCEILLWVGCPKTRSRCYVQSVEPWRCANTDLKSGLSWSEPELQCSTVGWNTIWKCQLLYQQSLNGAVIPQIAQGMCFPYFACHFWKMQTKSKTSQKR